MCSVYSIGFSFLPQILLLITRGEKNPNKPAWINKKNFIVFTKDHSYCHLQYLPLNPRALLMPGLSCLFLMQEHVPASPRRPSFLSKGIWVIDALCGRDVILCSIPGSPCRSPTPRSPPPCELQSEQWLSRGPRARLSWSRGHPRAMLCLWQRLSHFVRVWSSSSTINGPGRERQRSYRVPAGSSAPNPQEKRNSMKVEQLPWEQPPRTPSACPVALH